MIKSELVHRISDQKPQLHGREVEKVVNTILDEIAAALARGDRVELRGFGVFAIKLRQARRGRNPRSGATASVPEKAIPFFKTGGPMHGSTRGAPARVPKPINISPRTFTAREPNYHHPTGRLQLRTASPHD